MKRFVGEEHGTTTAELALVLPTVLLILFGIVEFSQVLGDWMILTNETREAARYAVAGVRDGDANLVSEVTTQFTSDIGGLLDATALTVTVTPTSDGIQTTSVTVTANYSVPMQTPFTKAIFSSVPIRVGSTMRAE